MKKKISLVAMAAILSSASSLYASGYRIPEQSINSTVLSNAYVANTQGADTAYFNPANMVFLENGWHTEAELMYIHLPEVDFAGTDATQNGNSSQENFVMPVLYAVSPAINNFRFGFALTYPVGLSKRWDGPTQRRFAEDFTLKTMEFNPAVSYKFCEQFSFGAGVRVIHASGEVRSFYNPNAFVYFDRDLEGDTTEYGYNLAMTLKPVPQWKIAATYRSKIELGVEGNADLTANHPGYPVNGSYSGYAAVEIPVPAVLTIGTAYTFAKTTVELNYDKTFWSAYEKLDFNYSQVFAANNSLSLFDAPSAKLWTNSEAYRIGITHKCTDNLTAMLGFAIDKNPIPDSTIGYELPDSDAKIYSLGAKYKLNGSLEIGAAYLYDDKDERTVTNVNVDGTFSGGGAHIFNLGVNYQF